jgi:hypothetical protein
MAHGSVASDGKANCPVLRERQRCRKEHVEPLRRVEAAEEAYDRGGNITRERSTGRLPCLMPPVWVEEFRIAAARNYRDPTGRDSGSGCLARDVARDSANGVCAPRDEARNSLDDHRFPSEAVAWHPQELALQLYDNMNPRETPYREADETGP